MLQVITARS